MSFVFILHQHHPSLLQHNYALNFGNFLIRVDHMFRIQYETLYGNAGCIFPLLVSGRPCFWCRQKPYKFH